jgi:hypothetical protein
MMTKNLAPSMDPNAFLKSMYKVVFLKPRLPDFRG